MPFQFPAIINPGTITNTEISASAAIAITKIATDISATHKAAEVHTANQNPEYTTAGLISVRMVM